MRWVECTYRRRHHPLARRPETAGLLGAQHGRRAGAQHRGCGLRAQQEAGALHLRCRFWSGLESGFGGGGASEAPFFIDVKLRQSLAHGSVLRKLPPQALLVLRFQSLTASLETVPRTTQRRKLSTDTPKDRRSRKFTAIMSDDEERVTMPFKFVTGTSTIHT